jgi:hypothetical protein
MKQTRGALKEGRGDEGWGTRGDNNRYVESYMSLLH